MSWVKSHWKILAIALAVVVAAVVLIVVLAGGGNGSDKDTNTETPVAAAAPKATIPPEQFECSTNNDGTIAITGYSGDAIELVIPSVIEGTAVTRIGYGALQYNKNITSIVIPEGVKTINAMAFGSIDTLKDVWLPASLEYCEYDAFMVWDDIGKVISPELTFHVPANTYAQSCCTDMWKLQDVTPENSTTNERQYRRVVEEKEVETVVVDW